jgi:hypothetical protein
MPAVSSALTPERLMQFVFGFAPPMIIETALRLRVFDVLERGARTAEDLCAEFRVSGRGLRIILDALVGLQLLKKDDHGRYALTPESSAFLVRDKPSFHGAFFLLTAEPMLSEWRKLPEIVRSGRPTHRINQEEQGVAFFLQFVEEIFSIHYPGAARLAGALSRARPCR